MNLGCITTFKTYVLVHNWIFRIVLRWLYKACYVYCSHTILKPNFIKKHLHRKWNSSCHINGMTKPITSKHPVMKILYLFVIFLQLLSLSGDFWIWFNPCSVVPLYMVNYTLVQWLRCPIHSLILLKMFGAGWRLGMPLGDGQY